MHLEHLEKIINGHSALRGRVAAMEHVLLRWCHKLKWCELMWSKASRLKIPLREIASHFTKRDSEHMRKLCTMCWKHAMMLRLGVTTLDKVAGTRMEKLTNPGYSRHSKRTKNRVASVGPRPRGPLKGRPTRGVSHGLRPRGPQVFRRPQRAWALYAGITATSYHPYSKAAMVSKSTAGKIKGEKIRLNKTQEERIILRGSIIAG